MNGARRLGLALLCVLIVWPVTPGAARSTPACAPSVRAVYPRLPGRIDSLLASPSGLVVALAGASASRIRFLPHDDLLLLRLPGGAHRLHIALPFYIAAPGLAAGIGVRGQVYVLVDENLLLLDGRTGRLTARRQLDMAAVGWPAALAAGSGGLLYIAGQPANAWAARVEALATAPGTPPRLLWRAPLGLTHAGIWLGLAGNNRLAVYLPDAHDAQGTVALLDTRTGALRGSYAVPAPPLAADPGRGLLYLLSGGNVQVLSLARGTPIAAVPGAGPLALDSSRGLLAFMQGDRLALAAARTLTVLTTLPLQGVTALAFTPDGTTLLAGRGTALAAVAMGDCAG